MQLFSHSFPLFRIDIYRVNKKRIHLNTSQVIGSACLEQAGENLQIWQRPYLVKVTFFLLDVFVRQTVVSFISSSADTIGLPS